jgi:hypothetical protein
VVHLIPVHPTAAACPVYGVLSTKIRQRRTTRPRDVAHAQAPFAARWHKVRSTCKQRARPRKALTDQIAQAPAHAWVASRVRQAAGGRSRRAGVGRRCGGQRSARSTTNITNAGTNRNEPSDQNTARVAFGFRNLDNQRRRGSGACTHRQPQAVMIG